MKESKYLRLALMFGDNNATTFRKNLEKMIALALHECYERPLSIVEIIDELRNSYGLEFSEEEVLDAINGRKQNRIICFDEYKDSSQNKYSITPDAKSCIDLKIESTLIKDTIELFLAEKTEIQESATEFEDTLKKYFYSVFNSNATTISELLDNKINKSFEDNVDFSDIQKREVNAFLEWDNLVKDKFVYQMVSCCFDYCMMTVKRDKFIYKNIFRKKKFYLDTNIVFRMMGLNRENRKKLIDTFINKCKESGIELLYTNQTQREINSTIKHHVQKIKELLNNTEPISTESLKGLAAKYYNLSFYEAYVQWCNDPANQVGDYCSFETDMKRQAWCILREFSYKVFDDYKDIKPDVFYRYCDALKTLKASRGRNTKDEVVQTDINNYMFIRDLNDREKANDFSSTHHYLISADHIFGDWAKTVRPESVPVVVLPSVWYSIILQYTGRAEDDFSSFTRFLNFTLSSEEETEDDRKIAILKRVIELDEPRVIKERTIFDIESKLQSDYKDFDSAEEIVEMSHEYIIDTERAKIAQQIQQEADLKLQEAMTQTEKENQAVLAEERARHAKVEFEAIEKNKRLLDSIEEARQDGARSLAESLADKALFKTILFYWIIAIVFFAAVLYFGVVFMSKVISGQFGWLPIYYQNAPAIIDGLIAIIISAVGFVVYKRLLCELDKDKIRNRLIEKYMKK